MLAVTLTYVFLPRCVVNCACSYLHPQSESDIARISKMLAANFMFQNLTATQKEKVFRVMTLRHVVVDELIIKEGDRGDEMYIVER